LVPTDLPPGVPPSSDDESVDRVVDREVELIGGSPRDVRVEVGPRPRQMRPDVVMAGPDHYTKLILLTALREKVGTLLKAPGSEKVLG
jgi:hypothetical protein